MELIVTRADNSNYNLPSENATITSAVQTRTLMGEDTVAMTVQSVGYINFLIGDWIEVFGRKYTLNTLGEPQRIGENAFEYNLVFEGVNYELTKVVYRSADYSGFNPTSDFPLTGTAEAFLTVLQYNLDRAFGQGIWAIGSFPATEAKTLSFTSENCLLALNRVCSEFGLEYEIKTIGGVKTINLGAVGDTLPLNLEYGKGKGLYSLTRTNVDSKNIVTRLYVEGSDRNVKAGYRDNALRLRIASNAESYIDSSSVASFGIIEGSKIFEDIFPHREGTVSAINASDILEFTDSSMDFDLAETDSNGTKWLIAGQSAKIHFNTGALAGYEFELTAYHHTTKTFKIKPFKDERGLQFPNPDSAAFQIKPGDKYVILDIIMPDSYIQAAEAELLARAQEYLSQNDQPRVEYSLDLDRFFLKSMFSGPGFDVNFLDAGDYLHIKDSKIGVDKEVRVKTFTRDVLDPWVYQVALSDVIEPTRIELLLADTLETKKAARQSKLFDPARSRRNWRDVEEVAGMVDTLRAEVALIGSPEGQFQIDSFFEVNKGGNPNSFGATAGVLAHNAFEGDAGSIWNIGAFDVALSNSGAYYLYAQCSRVNTGAVFTVSLTKIGVEDVGGYYHFPVGIISSVKDNARTLTTVYGYTLISGNNISTGIIKNENSGLMINLETGDIQGKFKFTSGQSVEDAIVDQQIYVEYSVNGTTGWHTAFGTGDKYMRQKKGAGNWSSAIRLVGIDGTSGTDGRSVSGMTTEFYLSNSKTTQTGGSWVTEPPTWVNGKYLWTRVKIDYINPASTAYTTPSVSSEWEAVNDLEIGGRNLISNIPDNWAKGYYSSATGLPVFGGPNHNVLKERISCEPNSYYTMSSPKRMVALQYDVDDVYIPLIIDKGADKTLTFKTHSSARYLRFDILFAGEPNELNLISEYKLKLEKGSKATDWAPPPEDVTAEITAAKQEALTAAGNAQSTANSANTAVGNLGGYVDGAFKDGVIDAAEAKAIEKYKNTLNEAMAKAESSYLKVYTNTYLSGAPKTALQNAKINLWGQRDTLISAINTAISGGTTTSAQKIAVDNAFGTFNTLMNAFQNALEEANKAIQVKLDTISKGYVDAIEVGGRNLLPNTSDTPVELSYPTTGWTDDGHPYIGTVAPLTSSKYILSFDAKSTANGDKIECYFYSPNTTTHAVTSQGVVSTANDGLIKITLSNKWERYWILYTQSATTTTKRVIVGRRRAGEGSGTISLKKVMLQEGNKSTDYSPALDYLATAIQDGSTDIEGGLVSTNVLKVKDTSGAVTGGMSGLSNDNVGFWTGGTYQEALDGLCAILFRKDGTGHIGKGAIRFKSEGIELGDMNLDEGGAWSVKENESLKLMISRGNIMSPESIYIGGQSEEGTFGSNSHSVSGEKIEVLGTYTIRHDGTQLTIKDCILRTWVQLYAINGYSSSSIQLQAYYPATGSAVHIEEARLSISGTTEYQTGSKTVNKTVIVPAGYMRLRVVFTNTNHVPGIGAGFYSQQAAGTIKIFHNTSNPHSEIGRNGFMFVKDAYNFVWFGVDHNNKFRAVLRSNGDFDMPGVLLRGTVEAGGGSTSTANWWGPKNAATGVSKTSTGRYVIVHSVGHVNYTVTAASRTANRSYHIVSIDNTQFIIEWRTIGSSPTLIDTTFDFTISGQNFLAP